jgi:hypothetical protein
MKWPQSLRDNWRVALVLALVFLLGIGRLWIVPSSVPKIDVGMATKIANCLGPTRTIAPPTELMLLPFLDKIIEVPFRVTSALEIDLGAAPAGASDPAIVGPVVTVTTDKGLEFDLPSGPVLLELDGARLYYDSRDQPRFGPLAKIPYLLTMSGPLKDQAKGGGRIVILPVGTKGTITTGLSGLKLVNLQPISAKPWLQGVNSTLRPVRAVGQQGLSDVSVEMRQSGLRFDEAGFLLDACAWRQASEDDPTQIGVAEIKAAGTGSAVVRLALPADIAPPWPDSWRPWATIEVAVASADGKYKGYGWYVAVPKIPAALVAMLIVAGGLWWLVGFRRGDLRSTAQALRAKGQQDQGARAQNIGDNAWFSSLFVGSDGQPSLSLFQIFFWTLITVWGIAYVYIVAGSLLTMTTSMMGLLGIAGVGTVAARWISPDSNAAADPRAVPARAKPFSFWEILSTNGNFDLLKLQLFVFTTTIGIYVVWRIADTAAFPELDANTLLLLGVSQGVYIGGKVAGGTALSRAQALKLDLADKQEARANLQAKIEADTKSVAAMAVNDQKTTLQDQITQNETRLKDMDTAIAVVKSDLDKAVKELGLTS